MGSTIAARAEPVVARTPPGKSGYLRRVSVAVGRDRGGYLGMASLGTLVLAAIAAPLLAPHNPLEQSIAHALEGPTFDHPFGTDEFGRDLLSRVIFGARLSLLTAGGATAVAVLIGVPGGMVSAYFRGWAELIIMRLVDFLLAVPAIILAMALIAVLGRSTTNALLAIAIVSVPFFARIAQASVLMVKEQEFVVATRSIGAGDLHLLGHTILPNILSPILVQMTITAAVAILLEASLSFLGLGTPPPAPSWGSMLSTGKGYLNQSAWYGVLPGLFLTVTVFSLDAVTHLLQRLLLGDNTDGLGG
jgi:peptide/nickel transport system permease protein